MNSFSSLLVICAVAAVSASIHEVNTVGRTHPRNSNDQPMLVSDIYAASEYFYGKESAVPAPEAIDPNNVPTLKVHHGLSATCTSKICDMFYYALTCKALDLGFNKECASYFLGANFACPQFPSPDDFFNAPSVCAAQMGGLVKLVASGSIFAAMAEYLGQEFQTNSCGRRCYQNYQEASNSFYQSCYSELFTNKTNQATYFIANQIMNFQQFRNQACAVNNNNTNCYVQFTAPQPVTPLTAGVNTFNMECNYYNLSAGMSVADKTNYLQYNNGYMAGLCAQFSKYQCCAANDVTMYQQAQTNASNVAIFPPCLLSYLTNKCPTVNLQDYCQNGSIASTATLTASTTIPRVVNGVGQRFLFPNMYNKTSVNQLQGAISAVFQLVFGGSVEPWIFNAQYPFQVQILDYVYMYQNNTPITPTNPATGKPTGVPYFPPGEDYPQADLIRVTYQVTVQNTASYQQAASYLNPIVNNSYTSLVLTTLYCGSPCNYTVPAELVTGTVWKAAQPLDLPNSAHSAFGQQSTLMMGLVLTSVCSLLLSFLI